MGLRPLREPVAREKGVAGEKGDLGKAEMLKTETLKGRMLGKTPRLAGSGEFTAVFI